MYRRHFRRRFHHKRHTHFRRYKRHFHHKKRAIRKYTKRGGFYSVKLKAPVQILTIQNGTGTGLWYNYGLKFTLNNFWGGTLPWDYFQINGVAVRFKYLNPNTDPQTVFCTCVDYDGWTSISPTTQVNPLLNRSSAKYHKLPVKTISTYFRPRPNIYVQQTSGNPPEASPISAAWLARRGMWLDIGTGGSIDHYGLMFSMWVEPNQTYKIMVQTDGYLQFKEFLGTTRSAIQNKQQAHNVIND
ncbi:capsid protein [Black-headed python circovirus 1]|uniref:Capsid protein n=1 Tax=Black-headed python circovirus 1 TaxID=2304615 RepID=A0A4P2U0N6_9CIRC|nr:capsid protein [Black-headed python circovirus 1]